MNLTMNFAKSTLLAAADKPYWSSARSFTPVSPRETIAIVTPIEGGRVGGGNINMSWLGVAGVKFYKWTLYEGITTGGKVRASRTVSGLADTYQWNSLQDCPSMGNLTLVVSGGGRSSEFRHFKFKSVAPQLREGKWGAYTRYYMSWSRVGGNQGYEVTITDLNDKLVLNGQVSRDVEHCDIPAAKLPKAGFKYSVKATGFDGVVGDPSTVLTEGSWGN